MFTRENVMESLLSGAEIKFAGELIPSVWKLFEYTCIWTETYCGAPLFAQVILYNICHTHSVLKDVCCYEFIIPR
jgi:hypothetical protein